MADTGIFAPYTLMRSVLMLFLGVLAIYLESAPLGLGPTAPPSPDLLLCVVCFWALRRPEATPILLVFVLGLMRDLLTDAPVGAGALTLVLTSEAFKVWRRHLSRRPFIVEWLSVALAAFLSATVMWGLVIVTLSQPPYAIDLFHQCLYTAMIYPLIAAFLRWVLRIGWTKIKVAA